MVEDILDDYLKNMLTGRPKKYLSFEEQSAAGRKLGDMLLPNGKRLNDCTGPELMAVGKAYQAAGKEIGRHRGTDLIPWSASRLVDRWEQRSGT